MIANNCVVCSSGDLYQFDDFDSFKLITSDCKTTDLSCNLLLCENCGLIQKQINQDWKDSVDAIYAEYNSYWQSRESSQLIIDCESSKPVNRTSKLFEFVSEFTNESTNKKLLDFGCSKGEFLEIFSQNKRDWLLYGADISLEGCSNLKQISGFETYWSADNDFFNNAFHFDLISLLHTLEHFVQPAHIMNKLIDKLSTNGSLLIQVPNIADNPFDLIIVDHVSHFMLNDVINMVTNEGLKLKKYDDKYIIKESLVIASKTENSKNPAFLNSDLKKTDITLKKSIVLDHLRLLNSILNDIDLISSHEKIGIFGTSISATWIYSYFKDRIQFFVDEDVNRVGQKFYGIDIISPSEVPDNVNIYIPLVPQIADKIQQRIKFTRCMYSQNRRDFVAC